MTESEDSILQLGRESAERPPVALGESAVGDRRLDAGRQVEQPERVGDRRSGAADAVRDGFLAEPELVDQLAIGLGRLERVEILALEVLDQGELELLAIGELADDGGDPLEAGRLGGSEPPFAGDELVAVEGLRDEDRLQDAVLADARRSATASASGSNRFRGWRGFGRIRLIGISTARSGPVPLRDQGGQAATETLRAVRTDGHDATGKC